MHNLQNTLNYLLSTVSEEELFESLIKVKSNFKDIPTDKITPFDEAIWTVSMLINEFNYQAAKQKKTAVYDKEEYTSWIAGQLQSDVHPLSGEELQKEWIRMLTKISTHKITHIYNSLYNRRHFLNITITK